jgi:type IV secretion system protein TrbC
MAEELSQAARGRRVHRSTVGPVERPPVEAPLRPAAAPALAAAPLTPAAAPSPAAAAIVTEGAGDRAPGALLRLRAAELLRRRQVRQLRGRLALLRRAVMAGRGLTCDRSELPGHFPLLGRPLPPLGRRGATTRRRLPRTLLAMAALVAGRAVLAATAAYASTAGADLPWNTPLRNVVDNLTGPTAKSVAALAFVLGGAMWAFTSHEQGAKRFGQALFGVAVVLGAVNLVDALGFQGAVF